MHSHRGGLLILAGLALAAVELGCQNLQFGRDNRGDENAIRQADLDWSKAAAARDVEKVVSYYAPDGAIYPPNSPLSAGQPAIKVAWTGMMNLPGFMVNWVPSRVEVSSAGDMGWSSGTYQISMNVPGTPANDHGKYVAIWKKQPDGNWKVEADIFNSDLSSGTSPWAVPQQSQALVPPPTAP
jgi:ketosteroid isomerase-like protein